MFKVFQTTLKGAVKYLVCFTIALQSVPAIAWIVKNIAAFNGDFMASNYIAAADTLVVDEYMGILYAVVIRLLGHGWILFLVQLALVAFFAWFMGGGWCLGLVVTNPFVLQSCFSCLPDALILACFMAVVGITKKSRTWCELIWIVIPEIALGLLNPDYVWLCAIIMAGVALYKLLGRQRSGIALLAVIIFSVMVSFGVNDLVTVSGSYGRVHKSVQFLAMQRLVWPDVQGDYLELKQYHGIDLELESVEASRTAEKLNTKFAHKLEEGLGKEAADGYFDYMSWKALQHGVRAVLIPIVRDELGYFFAPVNCFCLETMGDSSPAYAKNRFLLTREWYGLFSLWVTFSILISSVFGIAGIFRSLKWCKKNLFVFLWITFCCSMYAALFCVRGFDYRNVLVLMAGWPLLILSGEKVSEE